MSALTPEEKAAAKAEKERRAALTPEEKAAEDAAEAKPAGKAKATSVSVEFNGGIREFSKELHGEKFADLAAEFAETNDGKVLA